MTIENISNIIKIFQTIDGVNLSSLKIHSSDSTVNILLDSLKERFNMKLSNDMIVIKKLILEHCENVDRVGFDEDQNGNPVFILYVNDNFISLEDSCSRMISGQIIIKDNRVNGYKFETLLLGDD